MATIAIESVEIFSTGVLEAEGVVIDKEGNAWGGGRNGKVYKVSPYAALLRSPLTAGSTPPFALGGLRVCADWAGLAAARTRNRQKGRPSPVGAVGGRGAPPPTVSGAVALQQIPGATLGEGYSPQIPLDHIGWNFAAADSLLPRGATRPSGG